MNRFFVDRNQVFEDRIEILGQDVNHISRVLRLNIGDKIEVVAGGYVYLGELVEIERDLVEVRVLDKSLGENEPKTKIVLYQGLAKGSKMDYIIQKCTELGVSKFYGLGTKRAVVKIDRGKKKESKIQRWQKVIDEAGKQSKRDLIPEFVDIIDFKEVLKILESKENILVAYEEEDILGMKEALSSIEGNEIHLIIGPEGGFEKEEIDGLKEIGGRVVSLGKRILRTETAGLVAASIVLYEFGDI